MKMLLSVVLASLTLTAASSFLAGAGFSSSQKPKPASPVTAFLPSSSPASSSPSSSSSSPLSTSSTTTLALLASASASTSSFSSSSSSTSSTIPILYDLESLKTEETRLLSLLSTVRTKKLHTLRTRPLRIGIVGFGKFGQFMAKTFKKYGDVTGISRSDYTSEAKEMGCEYVNLNDIASLFPDNGEPAKIDVLVLSVSILSFEKTLANILPLLKNHSVLLVDVLSVKEHPRRVLLSSLPEHCDILCTHPMYGPESGKNSWSNLNFVFEKTRIGGVIANLEVGKDVDVVVAGKKSSSTPEPVSLSPQANKYASSDHASKVDRVERFLSIFEEEGCRMVEMPCHEHDVSAANSQFITHLIGRILGAQGLKPTAIDTKGFQSVMSIVSSTTSDSFDLFYGLYKYNGNSLDTILKLRKAMDDVEKSLKQMERKDINAPGWGGTDLLLSQAGSVGMKKKM